MEEFETKRKKRISVISQLTKKRYFDLMIQVRFFCFGVSLFICVMPTYSQIRELSPLFSCSPVVNEQYGITAHITWRGYDYDNFEQNINNIVVSGNNVMRLDFNSPGIGWESGRIDYTIWDNVYSASNLHGLKLLPIVYKPRYKIYTKEYGDSYINFLKACLSRYGDNVVGWEIWNEMDQKNAEDGTAPPSEYLLMLKDAYTTIKEHRKDHLILLGAIGDLGKNYFEELLQKNATDNCDIFSIHYYSHKNPPENIISFYERLKEILDRYHATKPVWLTETGYVSESDNKNPDLFYTSILPKVYKQLGINCSKSNLGILYDERIIKGVWNQDNTHIGYGFKTCELVPLCNLGNLSVEAIPVLMILFGEKFPKGYFDDLLEYVKRGGTIVFPEGGAFLYYDWDLDTDSFSGVGGKYYKQLHVGCMFPWGEEAKKLGITKLQAVKAAPRLASSYSWRSDDFNSPIFLTDTNLHDGDEMISLIEGTDGTNTGSVAACYKLNSDLKGNIIVQTRPKLSNWTSESHQASRFPRLYILSYAFGVDKVFAYNLRDRDESFGYGITHQDMTPKPVSFSLRALSKMLPSGSTRPVVKEYKNQYIASWRNPNGKNVYCVWSSWVGQPSCIVVKGRTKYYDEQGKRICEKLFQVSPSVTYLVGATSVEFEL